MTASGVYAADLGGIGVGVDGAGGLSIALVLVAGITGFVAHRNRIKPDAKYVVLVGAPAGVTGSSRLPPPSDSPISLVSRHLGSWPLLPPFSYDPWRLASTSASAVAKDYMSMTGTLGPKRW